MTPHAKYCAGGLSSAARRLFILFAAALLAVALLTGCGKGKTDKKGSSAPAGSTTATETASAPPAPAGTHSDDAETTDGEETDTPAARHLDFYTERYISDEERLQRRQQRIEEELSS